MRDSPTRLQPNAADTIGRALQPLRIGDTVMVPDRAVVVRKAIPNRHKLAVAEIGVGQPMTIGHVLSNIAPDRHIHIHNLAISAANAVHYVGKRHEATAFSTAPCAALFDLIIVTASGHRARSDIHGLGSNGFVPWQIGSVI